MQTKSVELITNCLICRGPFHQQPEPPLRTRGGGTADKLSHPPGLSVAMGAIWDNPQKKWVGIFMALYVIIFKFK